MHDLWRGVTGVVAGEHNVGHLKLCLLNAAPKVPGSLTSSLVGVRK